MDGVLVDSMGAHCQSWTAACNQLGMEIDEMEIYLREGEKDEKSARHFIKSAGLMLTKARVKKLVDLKNEYFAVLPSSKLFPGVTEVIKAFFDAGYKTGVVTGSPRDTFEQLLPDKILAIIDTSVCGDEVIHGKPNPEPYLKGIISLGLSPKEVVVVENAPYGIESAIGAGAHVIAVRSYLGDQELSRAHELLDDIRDLPKLLVNDPESADEPSGSVDII